MITLDTLRAAATSPQPWTELDKLVRAELTAGRLTRAIYDEIVSLQDALRETPGYTEDAEEAIGDTLDALMGFCRAECAYKNPPVMPSEEEIAKLPRWARVALLVRSVKREFPLYPLLWTAGDTPYIQLEQHTLNLAEQSAALAEDRVSPQKRVSYGTVFAGMPLEAVAIAQHLAEVALCVIAPSPHPGRLHQVLLGVQDVSSHFADITPIIRRDFDHIAALAEWQHWTDDTPVPPEVFGPLWPEGPPAGWPPATDVPPRTDVPLEVFARERATAQMIEDDVVNLFNALNRYHIARSGVRLTLEQLRSLVPALVPVEN